MSGNQTSRNNTMASIPMKPTIKARLFQIDARHRSPRERLQERLIEKAVEDNQRLRAGTDLEKIKQLS